jgi:ABC transport system ATP-binding/permease protein
MSEEILKALMQLFAIIAKQDTGSSVGQKNYINTFLRTQLNELKVNEYFLLYNGFLGNNENNEKGKDQEKKLTSMKDSVRTLSICKKINKTLTQKQKVVVLIRLYEFICADNCNTEQRLQIISTVSEVFKITDPEKGLIEEFMFNSINFDSSYSDSLLVSENDTSFCAMKLIKSEGLHGTLRIIKISSVNLYFLKYEGHSDVFLNGIPVKGKTVYLLPQGGTIRLPRGTVYYSDIVSRFQDLNNKMDFVFSAENISFKFKTGEQALRDINLSEKGGKLIGIMGGSGAGKTTLLNVLSGIEKPSTGSVTINGINIHSKDKSLDGLIGYISQDDLLFEDLTVFQNLYYNAELCHGNQSKKEVFLQTIKTLSDLGLQDAKAIKAGSPLNKMISGGQRKRLNIALELIREPPVLFVDEPTSGLSSKDSENVMDLLKELSLKGKQIFVVIHQPSSDIYKMFDKVIVLDKGGYQIYYGNPIEAVMYFKNAANHLNSDIGECESCGNVNPEIMFNIIEAKEVDEYGNSTENRKVLPTQWAKLYDEKSSPGNKKVDENIIPKVHFFRPGKIKQFLIFLKRDLFSKLSNKQYLLINLLEAPLLAFILAGLMRYYSSTEGAMYIFKDNENIPAYIFISVIVMLFLGLTVSAEEIFRDKKILKREQFLNLSKSSYLYSKIFLLFMISAIQSVSFVIVGNYVVGIKGMTMDYSIVLFSVAMFANIIGLNISSAFNSAVTIYIIIPLLIIPQMILGGAMISYDKINKYLGGGEKVPVVAEFMISRWAYEALMVNQFIENNYEKEVYYFDKKISQANYLIAYYLPELIKINTESKELIRSGKNIQKLISNRRILNSELNRFSSGDQSSLKEESALNEFEKNSRLIDKLSKNYSDTFNYWDEKKEKLINNLVKTNGIEKINQIKEKYSNENLSDILCRSFSKRKIIRDKEQLIQIIDPVFQNASHSKLFSFNEPLFLPEKRMYRFKTSTLVYNVIIMWLFSVVGFVALYFGWLSKILNINILHFIRNKIRYNTYRSQ